MGSGIGHLASVVGQALLAFDAQMYWLVGLVSISCWARS